MDDVSETPDRLVDTVEAARMLGVHKNTLEKARTYGGPNAMSFIKIGRLVKYSLREIALHKARNTYASTGECSGY